MTLGKDTYSNLLEIWFFLQQAQRDLASVLPALQEATTALDSLDKSDISEIRVYAKPPDLVKHVMGAVCVLMKNTPDWSTSKHLLADQGFLKKLVNFDKNSVSDKVSTIDMYVYPYEIFSTDVIF